MPKQLLATCKVVPDSKGIASPELHAASTSTILGGHNQVRFQGLGFAATLAALGEPVTEHEPKISIPALSGGIDKESSLSDTSLIDNRKRIFIDIENNSTSIFQVVKTNVAKNSYSSCNLLQTDANKIIIKRDVLSENIKNTACNPLISLEFFTPLQKQKSNEVYILKEPLNDKPLGTTPPQGQDTPTQSKKLQFPAFSKPDIVQPLSADLTLSVSNISVATSTQTSDINLVPDSSMLPHATVSLFTTDIISSKNGEQKGLTASSPAEQIAPVMMRINSADGARQISLQLTPKALGRVDILIEQPSDGPSIITITANHQKTLDLLKADQAQLSQVLDRSGLTSEHRIIIFHLSELPSPVNTLVSAQQPPHDSTTLSASGGQAQSQFDQGASSDHQRRSSTARTPYALSFSADTDASWQRGDSDSGEANISSYSLNITA